MKKNNQVRENVIKLLQKHPEGLHILDIARLIGSHRHTVTKYIYELTGAETIRIREIGTAKLCFLNERFIKSVRQNGILKKENNE